MSFFDDVFNKLFNRKGNTPSELIHEPLVRSEKEKTEYKAWFNSPEHQQLSREVYNAYHLKKRGIATQLGVHVLETKYANGFAISCGTADAEPIHLRNLFDSFKDAVLKLDYKLAQKDRRIMDKSTYEETIEKWYLKPRAKAVEKNKSNQLYGNILIEYVLIDRKPSYIKLSANVYQDRLYSEALPFDGLLEKLFEKEL